MYVNQAGRKVKPCCVFMKIHLRQSFAGTYLSQLVGAESFEGDASDFGKCFTPILRLRMASESSAKSIVLLVAIDELIFFKMVKTTNQVSYGKKSLREMPVSKTSHMVERMALLG